MFLVIYLFIINFKVTFKILLCTFLIWMLILLCFWESILPKKPPFRWYHGLVLTLHCTSKVLVHSVCAKKRSSWKDYYNSRNGLGGEIQQTIQSSNTHRTNNWCVWLTELWVIRRFCEQKSITWLFPLLSVPQNLRCGSVFKGESHIDSKFLWVNVAALKWDALTLTSLSGVQSLHSSCCLFLVKLLVHFYRQEFCSWEVIIYYGKFLLFKLLPMVDFSSIINSRPS